MIWRNITNLNSDSLWVFGQFKSGNCYFWPLLAVKAKPDSPIFEGVEFICCDVQILLDQEN